MKKIMIISLLLTGLLLMSGCNKLNQENYSKLKVGMSYQEITAILGDSDTCKSALSAGSCTWGDDQKNITVKFMADKAVFFSSKGL